MACCSHTQGLDCPIAAGAGRVPGSLQRGIHTGVVVGVPGSLQRGTHTGVVVGWRALGDRDGLQIGSKGA